MQKIQHSLWGLVICCLACMLVVPSIAGADTSGLQDKDYQIGKGDVLEINVWKEEELTRTLKVRVDGKISIPLVDDIQAAGRSPMQLKAAIQKKLSEFIEGPQVTVIVQEQFGEYYLIGEVGGAGAYPLLKDLTLTQAIAKSSGFTEWADKDSIVILRREDGKEKRIEVDYDALVSGESSEKNVLIQRNDTIIVP